MPRLLACMLLALGACALVFGYDINGDRWRNASATIHVGLPGTAPSGQRWSDAFKAAMALWTNQTPFQFIAQDDYGDPCAGYSRNSSGSGYPNGSGDNRNGVDFRSSMCGNDFGSNVLAITLNYLAGGNLGFNHIVQSDIVFNDKVSWDIYDGPPRSGSIDFHRTALHELGHVLGLSHESKEPAIMKPSISALNTLQPDDIAGATALYSVAGSCTIAPLPLNAARHSALQEGSCRVLDLFASSDDSSFVEVYRIHLTATTTLQLHMRSSELDAVLLITDLSLGPLELFDDTGSDCNAHGTVTLPAGDYLLLANTYKTPRKCAGNTGRYSLSITDTGLPLLGDTRSTASPTARTNALITGGANTTAFATYRSSFGASEAINASARVYPASLHTGRPGKLHVLAILADGRQFMQDASGTFIPFSGDLSTLAARHTRILQANETLTIASALQGNTSGLAGQAIKVYVGYSVDSDPGLIHYADEPIQITIAQ